MKVNCRDLNKSPCITTPTFDKRDTNQIQSTKLEVKQITESMLLNQKSNGLDHIFKITNSCQVHLNSLREKISIQEDDNVLFDDKMKLPQRLPTRNVHSVSDKEAYEHHLIRENKKRLDQKYSGIEKYNKDIYKLDKTTEKDSIISESYSHFQKNSFKYNRVANSLFRNQFTSLLNLKHVSLKKNKKEKTSQVLSLKGKAAFLKEMLVFEKEIQEIMNDKTKYLKYNQCMMTFKNSSHKTALNCQTKQLKNQFNKISDKAKDSDTIFEKTLMINSVAYGIKSFSLQKDIDLSFALPERPMNLKNSSNHILERTVFHGNEISSYQEMFQNKSSNEKNVYVVAKTSMKNVLIENNVLKMEVEYMLTQVFIVQDPNHFLLNFEEKINFLKLFNCKDNHFNSDNKKDLEFRSRVEKTILSKSFKLNTLLESNHDCIKFQNSKTLIVVFSENKLENDWPYLPTMKMAYIFEKNIHQNQQEQEYAFEKEHESKDEDEQQDQHSKQEQKQQLKIEKHQNKQQQLQQKCHKQNQMQQMQHDDGKEKTRPNHLKYYQQQNLCKQQNQQENETQEQKSVQHFPFIGKRRPSLPSSYSPSLSGSQQFNPKPQKPKNIIEKKYLCENNVQGKQSYQKNYNFNFCMYPFQKSAITCAFIMIMILSSAFQHTAMQTPPSNSPSQMDHKKFPQLSDLQTLEPIHQQVLELHRLRPIQKRGNADGALNRRSKREQKDMSLLGLPPTAIPPNYYVKAVYIFPPETNNTGNSTNGKKSQGGKKGTRKIVFTLCKLPPTSGSENSTSQPEVQKQNTSESIVQKEVKPIEARQRSEQLQIEVMEPHYDELKQAPDHNRDYKPEQQLILDKPQYQQMAQPKRLQVEEHNIEPKGQEKQDNQMRQLPQQQQNLQQPEANIIKELSQPQYEWQHQPLQQQQPKISLQLQEPHQQSDILKQQDIEFFNKKMMENSMESTSNSTYIKSFSIIDGSSSGTSTTEVEPLPVFDYGMPRNITGRTGHTEAIIKCRVDKLNDKSVSWIRKRDLHILTVGTATYTSDKRFQVTESKDSREWTLHVKAPQARDSGIYECQINTEPKMSMAFQLNIIEISPDAKAVISGPPDLHFKVGSAIILNCLVQQPSIKDIGPIYWYRGEHMITPFDADAFENALSPNTDVSDINNKNQQNRLNDISYDFTTRIAMESQLGDTLKSRLRISNAQTTDTGNYTCQPTTASSASVMVHVINDENPAAMQKSNGKSLHGGDSTRQIILAAIVIYLLLHNVIASIVEIKFGIIFNAFAVVITNGIQFVQVAIRAILVLKPAATTIATLFVNGIGKKGIQQN